MKTQLQCPGCIDKYMMQDNNDIVIFRDERGT